MHNNEHENKKIQELVEPANKVEMNEEVSLEQLESLCYTFGRRPRGCTGYTSVGDTDEILF
jgi:hypothetical protein